MDAIYAEVFRISLAEWSIRVEDAVGRSATGWQKVDLVITAGFRFFMDHPEFVRLVRREALEGGSRLGMELGEGLRPYFNTAVAFFEREMAAGRLRRHDPAQLFFTIYGALVSYFSDIHLLEGLLGGDPLALDVVMARLEHLRSLLRAALEP